MWNVFLYNIILDNCQRIVFYFYFYQIMLTIGKLTIKKISEDPTNKQKNRLINILKNIKTEGGLNEKTYRRLYPTGAVSTKFYGLPNVHKPHIPLRPIVSSSGTATYNTAKELARILKPLVGNSIHYVQNTKDFVQIKETRLKQGECIISYDVAALFTSVPIQPVINIIKQRLANDIELHQRTSMSINHITTLLEFCLKSTSFAFQGITINKWKVQPWEVHSVP